MGKRFERHLKRRELRLLRGEGDLTDGGFELLELGGNLVDDLLELRVALGEGLLHHVADDRLDRLLASDT